MEEDFVSAAARHLDDSEHLLSESRVDNAGYLAGYVVECSIKAVIMCGGGPHPKQYGHDLALLGREALDLALLLSPSLRCYRPETIDEITQGSGDWQPSWRYAATGDLTQQKAQEIVESGKKAFEQLIIPIVLDGWKEVLK